MSDLYTKYGQWDGHMAKLPLSNGLGIVGANVTNNHFLHTLSKHRYVKSHTLKAILGDSFHAFQSSRTVVLYFYRYFRPTMP